MGSGREGGHPGLWAVRLGQRALTPKSSWSLLLLVGPRALMRHYYVLKPGQDSIDTACLMMVNNAITIIIPRLMKVIMVSNDHRGGGGTDLT